VRLGLIITLSSALFKSYFRSSSQRASVSFFSRPKVMLAIDIAVFVFPAIALQFVVGVIPADLNVVLAPLVAQAMISLPLLMTSAVIVAGLMFELGQGSAISSSEAVNWWPVSTREYVAASALSTSSLYSAFLAFSAGVTLPLAVKFGLFYTWPVMMLLSIFSLLLGAFIVEALKGITNRVSAVAYKKSGRLTLAVRLVALVLLLSIIQLAFQPYVLYWFFGKIVAGIEVVWMMPFVWPSAAMVSLLRHEIVQTALYTILSILFTVALYEIASRLRSKYWSPVPISISMDESTTYVPRGRISKGFGFSPLASLLALKELRALVRRRDLARFIAIPVVISVSFLAPFLFSSADASGRAPGFFLAAFIPLFVPLMFSSISIGQEGNSIANLLSLPIKPADLIRGKLAPTWLIASVATLGIILVMELLAPLGPTDLLAVITVSAMTLVINSFIGLGVGSRWPDYTIGARSRYVSMKGFLIGLAFSGLATIAVDAPVALHIITSGGVRGQVPFLNLDLLPMLAISIVLGSILIVLSYIFCKKGVENLLTYA
jgi:hypothetical protein